MTPWQEAEYRRCRDSFEYFCNNYFYILHPKKGPVLFKLYDYQIRVFKEFEEFRFNIVSKFRQAGLTTLAVAWSFWCAMFKTKDNQILIVSTTDREAIKTGKKVDLALEKLPEWLKPALSTSTLHEKGFADSGGVIAFHTIKAARSRSASICIIDEAAHIDTIAEEWKAIFPVLATGGRGILISTVNGVGTFFHKIYVEAQENKNDFHICEIDYWENPEYAKPGWADSMRANLGEKAFCQEILRKFLGSGDTFLDGQILTDLNMKTKEDKPIKRSYAKWDSQLTENDARILGRERGALQVWKYPDANHDYVLCFDASSGVGKDFSAFHVLDISGKVEQVAEFYSSIIDCEAFAQTIRDVGIMYNTALVVGERTGTGGLTVLEKLEKHLAYENLYYKRTNYKAKAGYNTDTKTRPIAMEGLREAISNNAIIIHSSRLANELNTFVVVNNRPIATNSSHDDLILSLAGGLRVINEMTTTAPIGATVSNPVQDIVSSYTNELIRQELSELFGEDEYNEKVDIISAFTSAGSVYSRSDVGIQIGNDKPSRVGDAILREFNW